MDNLIANGDFSTGELSPWTTTAPSLVKVRPDGTGYLVDFLKGGGISQQPTVTQEASIIEFDVRTPNKLSEGEFVLFTFALIWTLADGTIDPGFIVFGEALSEWEHIKHEMPRREAIASYLEVRSAAPIPSSNWAKAAKSPFGPVQFKNFKLTVA